MDGLASGGGASMTAPERGPVRRIKLRPARVNKHLKREGCMGATLIAAALLLAAWHRPRRDRR